MSAGKVAAIFDVGKTNKKLLLFDEHYGLVYEKSMQLPETVDEDGFNCEDIHALTDWVISGFEQLSALSGYQVAALNFSAYGASFVHINRSGEPCTPLYNYLKPYPSHLQQQFYNRYGGEETFSRSTASPILGSLNSGMQLYRLKYEQPDVFSAVSYSLHLPQYLSYILSDKHATDITSLGCHTGLWNFETNSYHYWVAEEEVETKLAPLMKGNALINDPASRRQLPTGVGLHDSSAALIPYLRQFQSPFILISTGTWCISMNPFNDKPLTKEELSSDCLCYLSYTGDQVKSSRLFAGFEHETQLKRINNFFQKEEKSDSAVHYSETIASSIPPDNYNGNGLNTISIQDSIFETRELNDFPDFENAYHQLIADIITKQKFSTGLVMTNDVKYIFVDGGFSKNEVFMNLLAKAFPGHIVGAATVAQSTGLGAALAIHKHWNAKQVPEDLIKVKIYKS